jgi:hypothetical protein
MNRRAFLKAIGSAALLPILPHPVSAATNTNFTRVRPSHAAWPSKTTWKQLNETVGGNLIPVDFPISILQKDPDSAAAKQLWKNLKNPFFIGDQPGLTQSLGTKDSQERRPT